MIIAVIGLLLFFLGLYIMSTHHFLEGMENVTGPITRPGTITRPESVPRTGGITPPKKISCPDLLIQKGNEIFLYNTKEKEIPGVNPIRFNNLHEYTEYIDFKRSKGIRCPVLHLKRTYDTQGLPKYKFYTEPENPLTDRCLHNRFQNIERGLVNAGFNSGSAPSYDSSLQNLGVRTPLDAIEKSCDKISDSAMDSHWGGVEHSRRSVASGRYAGSSRKLSEVRT